MRKSFSKIPEKKIKLPKISKTPTPVSPKVFQTDKSDFQLDLNIKHRILKSMFCVEKESSANQDSSSLSFSFKRMSAGLKVLGNYSDKANLIGKISENLHEGSEINYKISPSTGKATIHCLDNDSATWAKKRGKLLKSKENGFSEFLADFFDSFDEEKIESISIHDLIISLMSYGVVLQVSYIERVKNI